MKLSKIQVSVISVVFTGLLHCSYGWAGGAAGGPTGGAGAGAANPAGATGGATNGTVGNGATTDGISPNGATPGATGNGNPGTITPARPAVNPNPPTPSSGQDVRQPANPARRDLNRVDPTSRDTRAGSNANNSQNVQPAPNNTCYTIDGQPTGSSQCGTSATPNAR